MLARLSRLSDSPWDRWPGTGDRMALLVSLAGLERRTTDAAREREIVAALGRALRLGDDDLVAGREA